MVSLLGFRISNIVPPHCRSLLNRAAVRPVPPPRGSVNTPLAFLSAIGREAETKITPMPEKWEDLWKVNGEALRKAGLAVKDRRYILWSLEKYRRGEDPAKFAHPPKPRRTVRGRGPSVQDGKRIRSRR